LKSRFLRAEARRNDKKKSANLPFHPLHTFTSSYTFFTFSVPALGLNKSEMFAATFVVNVDLIVGIKPSQQLITDRGEIE